MKNFVIFFRGKEGTSPIVRLLANIPGVEVLHQVENKGWEPFDAHNCGPMELAALRRCLKLVWGKQPVDMEELNRVYLRSAARPLAPIQAPCAAGFKMRFRPPTTEWPQLPRLPLRSNSVARAGYAHAHHLAFRRTMFRLLDACDVVTFIMVRQDVFRWGLSRYHGGGTGKPGHLQFRLASGEIQRDEIPKISVDCNRLETEIKKCEQHHRDKVALITDLRRRGIRAYPLIYERFFRQPVSFFERLLQHLEVPCSRELITAALEQGSPYQKVHSDNISEYVINHDEVLERFQGRYVSWEDGLPSLERGRQ